MKIFIFILFPLISCGKNDGERIIEGNLTNEEIAILIAEKRLNDVYGKSAVDKQKPFVSEKKNDSTWIVRGTREKPMIGGVAYAEVNVKKQTIISYTHGE